MKYFLINILFGLSIGILLYSCSEMRTDIPVAAQLSAHKVGFADPMSASFHGKFIKDNNWSLKQCQICHAADFSGGTTGASCNTCHKGPDGPAACNTCHGNFSDPSHFAPPRDLNGDSTTTVMGVGAHTNHLYNNSLSNNVVCQSCHNVPQSVFAAGHLDSGLPAEVTLQDLAIKNVASNASFNYSDGTCSNTYCHGNFEFYKDSAAAQDKFVFTDVKMTGNNQTVKWTQVDGTQAACGTCHDLPPKGHIGYQQFPISSCVTCHAGVVDESGNIIDKTKHINGKINVRGN